MRYFSLCKRYITLGDVFISSEHPIRKSPHQDSPYILRALSNLISLNMFILVPIFYWNIFRFRRTQDLITGRKKNKNDTKMTFWKIYQDSAGVKGGEGRRATCSQPRSTSLHGFSRFWPTLFFNSSSPYNLLVSFWWHVWLNRQEGFLPSLSLSSMCRSGCLNLMAPKVHMTKKTCDNHFGSELIPK